MTNLRMIIEDPKDWIALNMWWLRWPALLAALALIAFLSFFINERIAVPFLMLLVALPLLIMGAYLLLRWMALGLILLMPANMVVPFAIGTGSETSLNATVLLILGMTGLWIFDMINNQGRIWLHRSRPILPLLLMMVVAFLSFLVGQLPWFVVPGASLPAQIGGLGIFIISACAFLLSAHYIRDIKWVEWMVWAFIIMGACFIFVRMVPSLYRQGGRIFQFGSFSSQFWTWFIILTLSQAWLNTKLHKYIRLGLFGLFAFALYIVLVIEFDWKSGWIPPLIGIAALFALYNWRLAVLMSIGGLFALPAAFSQLVATDEYSYSTRMDAWIIMGEIIQKNPILGLGPSNYYWYTPLYSIRGYQVEFNSHNQYLDLLAQVGIVGTVVVVWFFVEVGLLGWKLLKVVPNGFPKAYVYGALAGLIATVISGFLGDWFLPFVYNVGIVGMRSSILGWVFLGVLVAMEQMYLRKEVEANSA